MVLKMESWPIERLVEYARNPRKNDHAVDKTAAAIKEFGFRVPIVAKSDGTIVDGHLRLKAARKLKLAEVPVVLADDMTEAQIKAFRISVNKVAELADWDVDLLKLEFEELQELDFDLDLTGFDEKELANLLADQTEGLTDPDEMPELAASPVTVLGDVWCMGEHRLLCGDSTDGAAIARLMKSERAALLFTSPPYGNQRNYTTGGIGDWEALMRGVFGRIDEVMAQDGQVLINFGMIHRDNEWQPYWNGWVDWMRAQGWRRFGWYVWDQGPCLPGDWNGRLAPSHEFIFHFNRQSRKPNKTVESKHAGETLGGGGLRGADGTVHRKTGYGNAIQSHRIPDSVFRIMRHKGGLGVAGSHPAVFPVALVEALLEAFTDPDDLVFEPFCGSGTQIVAGERAGRRVRAIELAPEYVDIAVKRWQDFFGKDAIHEATGKTFKQMSTNTNADTSA